MGWTNPRRKKIARTVAHSMDPHAAPPHAAGPVLTPAQATATDEAWARGQAAAAEDARRCLSCDTSTPFANLDDAIERLLPFHVFGSAEPDEMDEEERGACALACVCLGRSLVSLARVSQLRWAVGCWSVAASSGKSCADRQRGC